MKAAAAKVVPSDNRKLFGPRGTADMIRLLIDEDVHGDIVNGLQRRQPALDMVRVQDVGLRHTPDPIILEWAAQQGRVVVSLRARSFLTRA